MNQESRQKEQDALLKNLIHLRIKTLEFLKYQNCSLNQEIPDRLLGASGKDKRNKKTD